MRTNSNTATMPVVTVLLTSQRRDPMSRLIQLGTHSQVSHAAIGGLQLDDVDLVLQSTLIGVHTSLRSQFFAQNRVMYEFLINVPVDVKGAINDLGDRYDVPRILGFIPVIIGRWLGKKLKNPMHSPHALICSELVQQLDPEGRLIPAWKEFTPAAPGDLLTVCKADGKTFTEVFHEGQPVPTTAPAIPGIDPR